jgi:hypothetical protein
MYSVEIPDLTLDTSHQVSDNIIYNCFTRKHIQFLGAVVATTGNSCF